MPSEQLTSLSVFCPAFNEAANLPQFIRNANRVIAGLAKKYELIVVDDGSTDDTVACVRKLQAEIPALKLVSHPHNLGYGASLKTGIQESQYDWIFFTDADNQFDVSELTLLIPLTQDYDIVLGWRKNRAEGASRALNALLFKWYIDILYRLHVRDIDAAFKLMKRAVVQRIRLDSSGAFTTSELLYKLKKSGIKFAEVPVHHYPRTLGTPTGAHPRVILRAIHESLALYLKMKLELLRKT